MRTDQLPARMQTNQYELKNVICLEGGKELTDDSIVMIVSLSYVKRLDVKLIHLGILVEPVSNTQRGFVQFHVPSTF